MKVKKAMVFTAAIMMAVSGMTASAEGVSIWETYCGADAKTEPMRDILARFQEAYPEAELEIEEVNSAQDSIATRITTALAADDLPDIYWYWGGFSLEAVLKGDLLMDVQDYLDATDKIKYEDISEAAWEYYTVDGVLRGFPLEGCYSTWMCNSEIFEKYGLEYPETMQDVIDISAVLNENGIIPLAIGSSGGNPGHFFVSELTHQLEGGTEEIKNFGSTAQFKTDNTLKVAETILALQEAGVFPQDTVANGDWTPSGELYKSEKAAMIYTYNWVVATMNDDVYEKSVIINTPALDGATVNPSEFVQTSANYGFVVTKAAWADPEKQETIKNFIDWIYADENYQLLVDAGAVNIKETDITCSNPRMQKIIEHYEKRNTVPAHFNTSLYRDAWNTLKIECDELFAGAETAEEFVNDIQAAYDEAVAEAE